MRFNLSRHFLLTCIALSVSVLLFAGSEASPNLEKIPTATSLVKEFSSAIAAGEEISVVPGQAVVMYSDHLPQAGGSGNEAISKTELKNQLKILAQSPSFEKIPAVWGLSNNCTYTMYVDIYYTGILRITVVDAKMAHQIIAKWSADNNVANHYTSENEIPCLAA
jgi:hypothetical protein